MGNFTEKPCVKAMQQEAPVENEMAEAQPTSPQLPNYPAVSEVERPPPYTGTPRDTNLVPDTALQHRNRCLHENAN